MEIYLSALDVLLQLAMAAAIFLLIAHAADTRDYVAHLERRISYLEERRK